MPGYAVEKFVEKLQTRYYCPICLECLRDTVQTKCGHRFCAKCFHESNMY